MVVVLPAAQVPLATIQILPDLSRASTLPFHVRQRDPVEVHGPLRTTQFLLLRLLVLGSGAGFLRLLLGLFGLARFPVRSFRLFLSEICPESSGSRRDRA